MNVTGIAIFVVALAALSDLAQAASAPAACSFDAWSNDKDPKGLNVRAVPDANAPVVAVLPPPRGGIAVEMHITGASHGWLQIDHAGFADYPGQVKLKEEFKGRGWVSGNLIGFEVNDMNLTDGPGPNAQRIAKLLTEHYGPDSFKVTRVLDCRGDKAEVKGIFAGHTLRGWVGRICSNQVTTCV